MFTPLQNISLTDLCKGPIMFDANILMVGIENRANDPNCSFENMKTIYMIPLFESFQDMVIHEMVYNELDQECKKLVDSYPNVTKVSEGNLFDTDPQYNTIFNNIANHERVQFDRSRSKDRGEVYSLAYAAFHKINCFSSKEIMVDDIAGDLEDLKDIEIITFDVIVLLAFIYYNSKDEKNHNQALKSVYKRYCEDVIKRHKLPSTLIEYIKSCENYI